MKRLITASFVLAMLACNDQNEKPKDTTESQNKPITYEAPKFNEDSAYSFIAKQVDFGPRVPNTKGHVECSQYLVNTMKSYGTKVIEQDFVATAWDGTKLKSKNIIASINPSAQKRILLAAHWDTRPYADQEEDKSLHHKPIDGANDGASGVGVLMEVARIIQASEKKPNVGIDIIFFDSEDYGTPEFHEGESDSKFWCLGSQYWSKNKHEAGYFAYYGILLDMIGAKDAKFYKEGVSTYYAKSVVDKVWATGQNLGYGKHFINKDCGAITDDHTFVNEITGIKMIDIIQYNDQNDEQFFGDYWHTHDDNIEVIDKETLKAVGQTLLAVLYQE